MVGMQWARGVVFLSSEIELVQGGGAGLELCSEKSSLHSGCGFGF